MNESDELLSRVSMLEARCQELTLKLARAEATIELYERGIDLGAKLYEDVDAIAFKLRDVISQHLKDVERLRDGKAS